MNKKYSISFAPDYDWKKDLENSAPMIRVKNPKSRDYWNKNIPIEDLAEPETDEEKFAYISRFEKIYGCNFQLSPWIDPTWDDDFDVTRDEEDIKLERIKIKMQMNNSKKKAIEENDIETVRLIESLEADEIKKGSNNFRGPIVKF